MKKPSWDKTTIEKNGRIFLLHFYPGNIGTELKNIEKRETR